MQTIELLSPARDAQTGIEAILHGADAVYIGGPAYGARAAVGNSIDDIKRLCTTAHIYGAKVYVTMNTILMDSELPLAEQMAHSLWEAGVDALIVQDLAFLTMHLPPIALHASTQMDNRDADKVALLHRLGFEQVVLARELTLEQIAAIHSQTPVALEAFVHGALCVSYSGRCHASQCAFGRSANRGQCAQFCRLAFDLTDQQGATIVKDRHLLSLRDMNRSAHIEAMMDAGISSFKIEGRLKPTDYVKNVTAFYRQQIDAIIAQRPNHFRRASYGRSTFTFTPDLNKSFNRGFTDYFLKGRRTTMHNFATPKAVGEAIGTIQANRTASTQLRCKLFPNVRLHAGDGLCFVDETGKLQGFRINRVDVQSVFVAKALHISKDASLYRNLDYSFTHSLEKPSATRSLQIDLLLEETASGYRLSITDEKGRQAHVEWGSEKQTAVSPQRANQARILQKLGDTPFVARQCQILLQGEQFIPASILTAQRRNVCELLLRQAEGPQQAHKTTSWKESQAALTSLNFTNENKKEGRATANGRKEDLKTDVSERLYAFNISNKAALEVCHQLGALHPTTAYENQPDDNLPLMTCKYCLRHALGACLKTENGRQLPSALYLKTADGQRYRLSFNCSRCEMLIWRK